MATTAPKTAPKTGPKSVAAPETAAEAPPKKSKMKLIVLIVAALVVVGGAGAGAWYFLSGPAAAGAPKEAKKEPAKAPVFVAMEPFTVNLQSESGNDQFLQVTFTLQVPDAAQEESIKNFMPQVRSRLLFLLSSKKASEISTVEGKKKLTEDIIATVNQPFTPKGAPQTVSDVFFTSFVIQ